MTREKVETAYVYRGGGWNELEVGPAGSGADWRRELSSGFHSDAVPMRGFEDGGNREVTVVVQHSVKPFPSEESIEDHPSIFSTAYKWGYGHSVIYGEPRTPGDPYVVVLEIAEDAHDATYHHLSPYPYMVVVRLVFTEFVVFADNFPDLVGLLGEVLPLAGHPQPLDVGVYNLHKWSVTSSW